jgi:hypothetical protein
VIIGRERVTAGLHCGGRRIDPRENWCHVLGLTLDETNGRSNHTLRTLLSERLDEGYPDSAWNYQARQWRSRNPSGLELPDSNLCRGNGKNESRNL